MDMVGLGWERKRKGGEGVKTATLVFYEGLAIICFNVPHSIYSN